MTLFEKVQEIVENISYRPGGQFVVNEDLFYDRIQIRYAEHRIDASNFDAPMKPMIARTGISYHSVQNMPYKELEKYIKCVVFDLIKGLEIHEVQEFLKYKNVHIQHPHPEMLQK